MGLLLALYHYDSAAGQIYLAGRAANALASSPNLPPAEIWVASFLFVFLFFLMLCGCFVAVIAACCCCYCIKEAGTHVFNHSLTRKDTVRVRGGGRTALEERGVYM